MDQNQPVDQAGNDLQKAIDNINNPNPAGAFSEPVAAPSSVPEGDSGELGDPVGPFPMPETEPKVDVVTPGPEPIAPLDPISLPDLSVSGENPAEAKVVTKSSPFMQSDDNAADKPAAAPTPQDQNPTPNNEQNPVNPQPGEEHHDEPNNNPVPAGDNPAPDAANPAHADNNASGAPLNNDMDNTNTPDVNSDPFNSDPMGADLGNSAPTTGNPNAQQIKESALRDLVPILNHVNVDPSQKFKICRDIFEDLHDYSVLDQAYSAASEIQDEEQRADSLLYLIESIDSM